MSRVHFHLILLLSCISSLRDIYRASHYALGICFQCRIHHQRTSKPCASPNALGPCVVKSFITIISTVLEPRAPTSATTEFPGFLVSAALQAPAAVAVERGRICHHEYFYGCGYVRVQMKQRKLVPIMSLRRVHIAPPSAAHKHTTHCTTINSTQTYHTLHHHQEQGQHTGIG